jgi:hypothetical protein
MKTDHKQLEFLYSILTPCRFELERLSCSEGDSFIKTGLEELTNKAVDFIRAEKDKRKQEMRIWNLFGGQKTLFPLEAV